jgi:hypothetical protein
MRWRAADREQTISQPSSLTLVFSPVSQSRSHCRLSACAAGYGAKDEQLCHHADELGRLTASPFALPRLETRAYWGPLPVRANLLVRRHLLTKYFVSLHFAFFGG